MRIISKTRALDKIYKRRNRYEIPDWQREEVWDVARKQKLIDSILRGWTLPKFYFLKDSEESEEFEVVDGQQRLSTIFEFFGNELELSDESATEFGGKVYGELLPTISDDFDDFEIQYDEILDVSEPEIKEFFQRLQQGLPLTSIEKLNAVHGKLRNFCYELAKHDFFSKKVGFIDKRYAHFDVVSKVAAIEIDGINTGLRFDDLKEIFQDQKEFSNKSAVAIRLKETLNFLNKIFTERNSLLKNRTIVQSIVNVAAKLVETGRSKEFEKIFFDFVIHFTQELTRQVELGQDATDGDYLLFQKSINANVKSGAKTRQEILLRKMFRFYPSFADAFDPSIIAQSGSSAEVNKLGESIAGLIAKNNLAYSAKYSTDLFKATNKTVSAQNNLRKIVSNLSEYESFISDLYFLFRESIGSRLEGKVTIPQSFVDVNSLRTDLQHDIDHGSKQSIRSKRKMIGAAFNKYVGALSPVTVSPERLPIFQTNLLSALKEDLENLLVTIPTL